jgi:hypothetical protein
MAIQSVLIGQGEFLVLGQTQTEEVIGEEGVLESPNQGHFEF